MTMMTKMIMVLIIMMTTNTTTTLITIAITTVSKIIHIAQFDTKRVSSQHFMHEDSQIYLCGVAVLLTDM